MKGAGELKILQGTHVFSQVDGGHENTKGDSKNPVADVQGDFHGVCSRGVLFGWMAWPRIGIIWL